MNSQSCLSLHVLLWQVHMVTSGCVCVFGTPEADVLLCRIACKPTHGFLVPRWLALPTFSALIIPMARLHPGHSSISALGWPQNLCGSCSLCLTIVPDLAGLSGGSTCPSDPRGCPLPFTLRAPHSPVCGTRHDTLNPSATLPILSMSLPH